ncbi:hypothetical protein OsccyDRAFT_0585 [Leptolyngbyaceae cyanobacterium JSC-12]|nr:hypothetical protein OsccyDRAFT_0585 [Leptolyngbyaceae cyanobacterium JSC-12]
MLPYHQRLQTLINSLQYQALKLQGRSTSTSQVKKEVKELLEQFENCNLAEQNLQPHVLLGKLLKEEVLQVEDLNRLLNIRDGNKILSGDRSINYNEAKILAGYFVLSPAVFYPTAAQTTAEPLLRT